MTFGPGIVWPKCPACVAYADSVEREMEMRPVSPETVPFATIAPGEEFAECPNGHVWDVVTGQLVESPRVSYSEGDQVDEDTRKRVERSAPRLGNEFDEPLRHTCGAAPDPYVLGIPAPISARCGRPAGHAPPHRATWEAGHQPATGVAWNAGEFEWMDAPEEDETGAWPNCPECGAWPSHPHADDCSNARRLLTDEERALPTLAERFQAFVERHSFTRRSAPELLLMDVTPAIGEALAYIAEGEPGVETMQCERCGVSLPFDGPTFLREHEGCGGNLVAVVRVAFGEAPPVWASAWKSQAVGASGGDIERRDHGTAGELAVDRQLAENAARVAGWRFEDETPTRLALAVHRAADELGIEPQQVEVVVRRRVADGERATGAARIEQRFGFRLNVRDDMRAWLDGMPADVVEAPVALLVMRIAEFEGRPITKENGARFAEEVRADMRGIRESGRAL